MMLIPRLICEQEYDARGDGLTNGGKGGAVKGVSTLLEGLKKKGLIEVQLPPLIRCQGFRVQGSGFVVIIPPPHSLSRVQGSGFRVQGL